MEFKGKVIMITGAAGDIGKEIARLFQQKGAKLILIDLDKDDLEQTALELNLQDFLIYPANVTNEKEIEGCVHNIMDTYGRIDVLINNAGIEGKYKGMIETLADDFVKVMNVNVMGVFYGLKHVMNVMINQGFGNIVNMSSIAGLRGSPGLASYSASKHAVIGLTKTAAMESAEHGIRVNAVCPAPVNTRMMGEIDAIKDPKDPLKARESYEGSIPLGRYAEPYEIAELILFLSSEKSSYITGGCYRIDGGSSI